MARIRAYQRHLREKNHRGCCVQHDAGRGRTWRDDDAERPVVMPIAAPEVNIFAQRAAEARARFSRASERLSTATHVGDLYAVINVMQELDGLLDGWIFASDEVNASRDFADHPDELREKLIASWLETTKDNTAGPDEISPELRAFILARTSPDI